MASRLTLTPFHHGQEATFRGAGTTLKNEELCWCSCTFLCQLHVIYSKYRNQRCAFWLALEINLSCCSKLAAECGDHD